MSAGFTSPLEVETCISIDAAWRAADPVYARLIQNGHGLALAHLAIVTLRAMDDKQLTSLLAVPQPCPDCGRRAGRPRALAELRHAARFAELGVLSRTTPPANAE